MAQEYQTNFNFPKDMQAWNKMNATKLLQWHWNVRPTSTFLKICKRETKEIGSDINLSFEEYGGKWTWKNQ